MNVGYAFKKFDPSGKLSNINNNPMQDLRIKVLLKFFQDSHFSYK